MGGEAEQKPWERKGRNDRTKTIFESASGRIRMRKNKQTIKNYNGAAYGWYPYSRGG